MLRIPFLLAKLYLVKLYFNFIPDSHRPIRRDKTSRRVARCESGISENHALLAIRIDVGNHVPAKTLC